MGSASRSSSHNSAIHRTKTWAGKSPTTLQSTGLEQQEAAVQFVVLFLSLEELVWITVKGEKMDYSDLKNITIL